MRMWLRRSPLAFCTSLPLLVVGAAFNRWQIGIIAAICAWLAEAFDEFPGARTPACRATFSTLPRSSAWDCFMHEITSTRKLSVRHMRLIESEMTARRDAEEQLKVLVDSSPAAILTTSSDGNILLANDAAESSVRP